MSHMQLTDLQIFRVLIFQRTVNLNVETGTEKLKHHKPTFILSYKNTQNCGTTRTVFSTFAKSELSIDMFFFRLSFHNRSDHPLLETMLL